LFNYEFFLDRVSSAYENSAMPVYDVYIVKFKFCLVAALYILTVIFWALNLPYCMYSFVLW